MTRIIPGVEVTVEKEVTPRQLAPSGVLGLVGLVEIDEGEVVRASNWKAFVDGVGRGSAHSMLEARQALGNGVYELVVSPVAGGTRAAVTVQSAGASPKDLVTFEARAPGTWGNGLKITVFPAKGAPGMETFSVEVRRPGLEEAIEKHRDLTLVPKTTGYLVDALKRGSSRLRATVKLTAIGLPRASEQPWTLEKPRSDQYPSLDLKDDADNGGMAVVRLKAKTLDARLQATVTRLKSGAKIAILEGTTTDDKEEFSPVDGDKLDDLIEVSLLGDTEGLYSLSRAEDAGEYVITPAVWPDGGVDGDGAGKGKEYALEPGADVPAAAYSAALRRLEDQPDVDMVLAAVQDFRNVDRVIQIYSDVIGHCANLSESSKGRIGFGQVPPDGTVKDHAEMVASLVSDRFVLCAPHGVVGAAAGLVGNLRYFHSPTFKTVAGLGKLKRQLTVEEQRGLLRAKIVPVATERGRGTIVMHGLTTDGDQISVRRVADHAVRGVKSIGDLFIGRLNNEDGRSALKGKLSEFLVQMEKENAIVPSTDGSDPAFKVDVYSSQADFAMGIVRVDLAVRPVRAIDYVYATILIQV